MSDVTRSRRSRVHSVPIYTPGARFVTEGFAGYNSETEQQVWNVQYWEIQNDGTPKLINPPPEDVAAYLLGRPVA